MKDYKALFEMYGNEEEPLVLNFLFVSLISSDTIIAEEDAHNSMKELLLMKEALEAKDIAIKKERKMFWLQLVESGIEICLKDIERIREEQTPEYQERLRKEREKERRRFEAKKLPEDVFEWVELHPNNIQSNPLEGYYAVLYRSDDGGVSGIKWTIAFQREELSPMHYAYNDKIERYNLFFKEYTGIEDDLEYPRDDVNNYGEFVHSYGTLDEAKKGAYGRATCACGWGNITKENIFII